MNDDDTISINLVDNVIEPPDMFGNQVIREHLQADAKEIARIGV